MFTLSALIVFGSRLLMVLLFLPFSALDKVINYRGAVGQAHEAVASRRGAAALILLGLVVEVFMPLGVLTGIADRAAALVLACYCAVTAVVWKQFWIPGDFWSPGESRARSLFWTFLKNFAVAGGFLTITFGTTVATVSQFVDDPLASSRPYG